MAKYVFTDPSKLAAASDVFSRIEKAEKELVDYQTKKEAEMKDWLEKKMAEIQSLQGKLKEHGVTVMAEDGPKVRKQRTSSASGIKRPGAGRKPAIIGLYKAVLSADNPADKQKAVYHFELLYNQAPEKSKLALEKEFDTEFGDLYKQAGLTPGPDEKDKRPKKETQTA